MAHGGNDNGVMYHTGLRESDLEGARYAILPGDPFRVPKIAALADSSRELTWSREYRSELAVISGEPVLVISHGIGGPSTAIAVEELYQIGISNFIRVGTSGGMQMDVKAGDIVVINAAIRAEGTSREYLPVEFPAAADLDITVALREAAKEIAPDRWHVGIAHCKDSYFGQHSPERMPVSYDLINKWQAWIKGGALVSEMESAALFTVCSSLRCRAGAVMLCVWNQEREAAGLPQDTEHDTELAIRVAIEGVRRLIGSDKDQH